MSKESTGKRITDELREYARGLFNTRETVPAIADRIDAAHEKAIASVMNDALYHANDKEMADLGWVRLPKDADGKHIHEHDKVDWRDHSGTWHKNVLVVAVCNDGCYVMDGMVFHVHASDIRHYHEPTVEDVLREMHAKLDEVTALYVGEAIDSDERDSDEARIFAEYAAKLRLADNGKEQ